MNKNIIIIGIIVFCLCCCISSGIIYFMTNKKTTTQSTQPDTQPDTQPTTQPVTQPTIQPILIINSLSKNTKDFFINTSGAPSLSAGAYGLKLLNSNYSGPVLELRRNGDNSIVNFYADANGNLSYTNNGNVTTLTSWLNGAEAYITKWYDQTGNNNHAFQSTNENQPKLNIESKVITFPQDTFLNLPDGAHPFNDSEYSYIFKCSINNQGGGIFGGGTMGNNQVNAFRRAGDGYHHYWYNVDLPAPVGYSDNSVITTKYSKTTNQRYIYKNGKLVANNESKNRQQTNNNNYIGKTGFGGNSECMNGSLSYIYILPINISQDDQLILENT